MAEDLLLDAQGLMKAYYGRRVVNNVHINVRRGEVVGLLGPNGAGKTTSSSRMPERSSSRGSTFPSSRCMSGRAWEWDILRRTRRFSVN